MQLFVISHVLQSSSGQSTSCSEVVWSRSAMQRHPASSSNTRVGQSNAWICILPCRITAAIMTFESSTIWVKTITWHLISCIFDLNHNPLRCFSSVYLSVKGEKNYIYTKCASSFKDLRHKASWVQWGRLWILLAFGIIPLCLRTTVSSEGTAGRVWAERTHPSTCPSDPNHS